MFEVRQTTVFSDWLLSLGDKKAKAVIARRISRVGLGLLGDVKSVGDQVSELRIDYGPGYRAYFTLRERVVIVLLCGGDKRSQARDIVRAKHLAKEL